MIARAKTYNNKSIFATIFGEMLRFADKSFLLLLFCSTNPMENGSKNEFQRKKNYEKNYENNLFNNCFKNNRFSLQKTSFSEIFSIF